jgi:undecaprenyl-diphosphatase
MTILQAAVMGVVEGLTEFLPVSSTFHLIMTATFLSLPQDEFIKFFEVFIQAGAIVPLVFLFCKELLTNKKLFLMVVAGFVPAAVIGLALHKVIKTVFFATDWLMLSMFIGVGLLFVVVEWLIARQKVPLSKTLADLAIPAALKIGLCQALAVIPGVSRSGGTMLGGLLLGFSRESATKFSFLLAIPTILAASALDLFQSREMLGQLTTEQWQAIGVGFITSLIVGWMSVNWLLRFVRRHSLAWFGWYRVVAGILLIIVMAR